MKKFTLILSLMVAMVTTTMAQTAATYADGVYKIFWEGDQRGYLTYHADYPDDPQLAGVVNHNPTGHYQLTDEGIQLSWYLYTSENTGKSYLFEATTGKFIVVDLANGSGGNGRRCALSEEVTEYAQLDLMLNTAGTYNILSYNSAEYGVISLCSGCGTNKGQGPVRFTTDGESDGGVPFKFVAEGASITDEIKDAAIAKIENFESNLVDVTYVYYLNGVKKHEAVKTQEAGTAYEAPAIDYLIFTYPEGSVTKETTTVDVTCSHALPFELSESYADAKWYYMTIRSNGQKYVARSESAPYTNSTNITMGENGRWAFMGNVFDGIKVYNNGAGENQTLGCDATATASHVYMKDGETSWIIEPGNGGFLLRQSGANEYIHDYASKLEIWNDAYASSDAGSALIVYDAEEVEAEYASNWVEEVLAKTGYVGAYAAELNDEIKAVTTYEEVLAFESSHSPLAVNTDLYYRLVCVSPKTDNSGDTNYNTLTFDGSANLVTAPSSASNINQIFKFEDAGDGKFYLKSMNADGYLNKINAGNYRSSIVSLTDACKVELINYSGVQWRLHNSESNDAKHCLFAENHPTESVPYACAGWESGANSASAWYIAPATDIEITVNTYASTCLPFAVETVDGVKAYAVESTNSTHAILVEKADIAAGEGAILEGNGTFTLNIIDEATTDWSANKLQGTTMDAYLAKDAYVLANGESGIGLYKAALNMDETGADGTTHFKNNANKAYLEVDGAESIACYSFRFGEGTTAVENVEIRNEKEEIYDLTGRRVESITAPGIYVVNGKKVLVK